MPIPLEYPAATAEIPASSPRLHFVHIPTPGDHYSPATGSAISTLIYQFAKAHAARGGETDIILARGTRHDYDVGRCIEVSPRTYPPKWQRAVDAGLARFGLPRTFGIACYRPSSEGIPANFGGTIFLHNNPVAVTHFRKAHRRAFICLWANNELFRTYRDAEVQRVADAADLLVCCSQYIANQLQSRLRRGIEKILVIRNGTDPEAFAGPSKSANAVPRILFIGRVLEVKGPDLLVKAALQLQSAGKRFELRIVGSSNFNAGDPMTPYEAELRRLARPLGESVTFHPFVPRDQTIREFQGADIFCVPSNWDDPCPLTVAEGLAAGLPMVVSNRGGIPEVAGDAALYFAPPNVVELATRLAAFLDNPTQRCEYATRARRRADEITWDQQYLLLREAVVKHSPAAN